MGRGRGRGRGSRTRTGVAYAKNCGGVVMNYNKNQSVRPHPRPPRAHDARDALARYAWARVACAPGGGVFAGFRPVACLLRLPTFGQISCRFSGKFGEDSGKDFRSKSDEPPSRAITCAYMARLNPAEMNCK